MIKGDMGKSKKATKHVPRVSPTPLVRVSAKDPAGTTKVAGAVPAAGAAAAAAAPAEGAIAAAAGATSDEVATRKDVIAAMPRMGAVTKLKAATNCTSILMVPLRGAGHPI